MSAYEIRKWAKRHKIEVADRGRISQDVTAKYTIWRAKADARNEALRKARRAAKAA